MPVVFKWCGSNGTRMKRLMCRISRVGRSEPLTSAAFSFPYDAGGGFSLWSPYAHCSLLAWRGTISLLSTFSWDFHVYSFIALWLRCWSFPVLSFDVSQQISMGHPPGMTYRAGSDAPPPPVRHARLCWPWAAVMEFQRKYRRLTRTDGYRPYRTLAVLFRNKSQRHRSQYSVLSPKIYRFRWELSAIFNVIFLSHLMNLE